MRNTKILLGALLLAVAAPLPAQDTLTAGNFPPPLNPPAIYATETRGPMLVDGRLNEPVWQQAPVTGNFFRTEPRQGGRYLYATTVKIVYDRKHLYLGAFCADSMGRRGIRVQDLRRDFLYGENDIFFVQLDPQNLKRYCVSFQSTPYGNQRDVQVFDATLRDNDWDALWKVRTQITDSGYYVEMAIPFKSLRYNKNSSAPWGITLARLARRDFEQTVFPAIPQAFDMYRMTYAAQLKGLQLPPPSVNLRFQPYTLFQYDRITNTSGKSETRSLFKTGGEIKWAITPNAVLDFTANTDFAQADADRAVNNLTRFNVFFPERRQFFLENNGVYAGADVGSIKPFFSRTIGLDNAQFNANPVPIDGGIRYTNRTQKRTLAGLYVHQRGTGSQTASNFGVFRYLKNYGRQNNMGAMLTHRLDERGTGRGMTARHNTTITVDGFIRPQDSWTVRYLASFSRNNVNDSIGFAGSFFTGYEAQNFYVGWLTDLVTEKYVPGMGFVFAQNTIKHNPGGYYIWRPKGKTGKLVRRWDPGLFVNWFQNAGDLKTQEINLDIFPVWIITANNGRVLYQLMPYWQNFSFSFPILGRTVAAGKYNYLRQKATYQTDASKKISIESSYEWGGYYNGRLNTLFLSGRLAPIPNIALTASYEHNTIRGFGAEKNNFKTDLYTGGLRLAYNPRIQLSAFYQYNTFDKRGRWNVRGSWELAPLSFIYIVFNENSFRDNPARSRGLITKFSYLKQF